jgi:hypothetical protein
METSNEIWHYGISTQNVRLVCRSALAACTFVRRHGLFLLEQRLAVLQLLHSGLLHQSFGNAGITIGACTPR